MPYVSKRARKAKEMSSALKICSQCLGDLEYRTTGGEGHYVCMECGVRSGSAAAVVRPADAPYAQESAAGAIVPDALLNRAPS
jgi:ribosomal protein L40E